MALVPVRKRVKGIYKKVLVERPEPQFVNQKQKARLRIESEVFDARDATADIAKWLAFSTKVMGHLYEMVPEEKKAELEPDVREIIEYGFQKFAETQTRGDVALASEGKAAIDKIMERQGLAAQIVKEEYHA